MELLLLGVGACLHCCVRKHRHTLQTQWSIVSTRCRNAHGRLDNPGLTHNNTRLWGIEGEGGGGNDITAVAEIQMISHLTLHWAPGYSKSWLEPRCWKYFSAVFSSHSPRLPLMGRRIHLLTIKSRRLFCWVSIGQYQYVCKVKCVWEVESKGASRRRQREIKRGEEREARDDKSPGKLLQQDTVAMWASALWPVCQTKSLQTPLKGRFPSGWRAMWNYPCLLNLSLHFTLIITSDPQEHLANCFSLFSFIMFNVTSRSCFMA